MKYDYYTLASITRSLLNDFIPVEICELRATVADTTVLGELVQWGVFAVLSGKVSPTQLFSNTILAIRIPVRGVSELARCVLN